MVNPNDFQGKKEGEHILVLFFFPIFLYVFSLLYQICTLIIC